MKTFKIYKARLTYDVFNVKAESAEAAAKRVANGKEPEAEMGVCAEHDTFYDSADTIVCVDETKSDECGHLITLGRWDEGMLS